ncbi:extracellular solute-binding protein [Actinomadura rupiterrae]|uniref:extracellular solute-binding protein n=1 Tax=Actinomadura rupiterrae TaxID=559627 RepID=UPI0020A25620|nr:extracellular solute-binding protein [Actinomadura rupiterrae]MCP2341739.1 multiple sugar transport system substrate-binding protein [Actinomadura rupiterrae]
MRKSTAGLLAVVLALAGCGRGGGGTSGKAEDVSAGRIKGTVTVWAMGDEGQALGAFAKEFERANPGVEIKVTSMGMDVAHDKLVSAIAGNATPDVSMVGTTWMGELGKSGALDVTPNNLFDKSGFFPGAWDSTVYKGASYGVPWYVETRAFYYRSDLGVKPPTTWDETKQWARQVKAKGASMGVYQNYQVGSWQELLPLVWQAGGDITSGGKWTFDSPQVVTALKQWRSFYEDGTAPNKVDTGAFPNIFFKGQAAAYYSGPWMIHLMKKDGGPGFEKKFDLAPYAKGPAGNNTSLMGGGDLAVFKRTKNRDAAWRFVKWLTDPKVQVRWYQTKNDLPSTPAAWQDPAMASDKQVALFGEALKTAKAPPSTPNWEQVARVVEREMGRLALLKETPEQAAQAMQKGADQLGMGD